MVGSISYSMSVRTCASVPKLTEDSSLSDLVQIYEISSPEEANALGDLGVVDERPTYGYRRVTALVNRLLAAVGKPTADHKRVFSPAASRRGDRIKVSRIAALLSALIVLTAVHRTQAQPAPDASWINLRASASHSSELVTTKEDLRLRYVEGRNFGVGKISLVSGSGEMSPEEFHKFYPPLLEWIRNTLDANAHVAQTVSSRGFSRLPHYFTKHTLVTTKVVIVDPLPVPPLASMGLTRFADFLRGDSDGITYIDTIFLKPAQSENENVYFHELIHVIQWRLLGPDRFLLAYANGLECFGYRQSPLEAMAYDAESEFASSTLIFNAEKLVADKLGL